MGFKEKDFSKERERGKRKIHAEEEHAQNTASAHIDAEFENFIIERKAIFTLRVSGDNWFHIFGYFIPSDNTRESAELREAYLAEEAERIAAMPVTMDLPEEGDE